MNFLQELEKNIQSNQIDNAVELVNNYSDKPVAISYLLEILKRTDSNIIRNTTAIVLSDLKVQESVDIIVSLLKDSRTKGNRGTLLYALEPLNYSEHLELISEYIECEEFEQSRQAFSLLEYQLSKLSEDEIRKYIKKIDEKIQNLNEKSKIFIELKQNLLQKIQK